MNPVVRALALVLTVVCAAPSLARAQGVQATGEGAAARLSPGSTSVAMAVAEAIYGMGFSGWAEALDLVAAGEMDVAAVAPLGRPGPGNGAEPVAPQTGWYP